METLFPFGFPFPAAMYLALFVLTAAIYMVFMNYVLAGSIVLLVGHLAALLRQRANTGPSTPVRRGLLLSLIRDWLPPVFGLMTAAAIAPLLFLEVLYRRELYSSTQVLFSRFIWLVPALVAAFLLLYMQKGEAPARRGPLAVAVVSLAAFACLLFVAWAWTGNHVLGLDQLSWQFHLHSRRWFYGDAETWPRLGYWITASFPTLAAMLAWQIHWRRRRCAPADLDVASQRLKALALTGLAMSVAEAWLWQLWIDAPARRAVLSTLALPYGLLAVAGMIFQAALWATVNSGTDISTRRLSFISAGAAMTILGALVVREARRLAAIDITAAFTTHYQAPRLDGLALFLVAFVINTVAIAICVLIVRRALRAL